MGWQYSDTPPPPIVVSIAKGGEKIAIFDQYLAFFGNGSNSYYGRQI